MLSLITTICFDYIGNNKIENNYNEKIFRDFKNVDINKLQNHLAAIPWKILCDILTVDGELNFINETIFTKYPCSRNY